MAKRVESTKTAGSRTRNVPPHELGPSAHEYPSQTPRPKTVKRSAKASPAPKISPGFKLGRLPPDR
jgi:hypothetical protein